MYFEGIDPDWWRKTLDQYASAIAVFAVAYFVLALLRGDAIEGLRARAKEAGPEEAKRYEEWVDQLEGREAGLIALYLALRRANLPCYLENALYFLLFISIACRVARMVQIAAALGRRGGAGDVLAGLSLLLDRPFVVGDEIAQGEEWKGLVERIGLSTTLIRLASRELLIIPNAQLVSTRLKKLPRATM
jgi:small-conductance mechanosensitive channel